MANTLSNLADNLAEGIHKIRCKDCDCFLEYESEKDNLIKYKCLSCNKDYSNKNLKCDSKTHLSSLVMISINSFWC